MNVNPMALGKGNDNDSKRMVFNIKGLTHEGLMPVSLKMLARCIKEKVK